MITRLIFKTLMIAAILFGLGSFASYLISGTTPAIFTQAPKLSDLDFSDFTQTISNKFDALHEKTGDKDLQHMYKWRDAKNVIHYASEKPTDVENYETITYHKDINVVPALAESSASTDTQVKPSLPEMSSTDFPKNVYSPEGVKHLLNQAKDVQNLANDQFQNTEALLNTK